MFLYFTTWVFHASLTLVRVKCIPSTCFQGGKEYLMRAHFGLPSVVCEDSEGKPPIQVKFEIPYFTTSGIQVNHYFEVSVFLINFCNGVNLFLDLKFVFSFIGPVLKNH